MNFLFDDYKKCMFTEAIRSSKALVVNEDNVHLVALSHGDLFINLYVSVWQRKMQTGNHVKVIKWSAFHT